MPDRVLIILAKYPRPSFVKTHLIPALGEFPASQISKLFLVDLLRRFTASDRLRIIIAGAKTDSEEAFRNLLAEYGIPDRNVEIVIPGADTIAEDMIAAYSYALEESDKAVLVPVDIPYVSMDMIENLFRALDEVDFVFHPNIDGDACPHGMRLSFEDIFRGSPKSPSWLPHLFNRIKSENISYKMFSPLFDIDRFEDLLMFYHWQIFLEDSGKPEFYCPATMEYLKSLTLP